MNEPIKNSIGICETQPVTAEGLKTLVAAEFDCLWTAGAITAGIEMSRLKPASILLVDKAFGIPPIMEWMAHRNDHSGPAAFLVWGASMAEPEALRLLQGGARGILSKTAEPGTILACLRAISSGACWMEDSVFRGVSRHDRNSRTDLTPREQQVMGLVEHGLKNKDIATELGIRPGTVKIHLKHIFEKTGVRGRYGLALTGLRERGLINLPRM